MNDDDLPPIDGDDDPAIQRLTKDLRDAAATLSRREVRFLVDTYYQFQDNRKRAASQIMALSQSGEPHSVVTWLFAQSKTMEGQIKWLEMPRKNERAQRQKMPRGRERAPLPEMPSEIERP